MNFGHLNYCEKVLSMFITDLFLLLSNDLNSIQTNTQWDLTILFLILKSYKLWLKSIFIKSLTVPWLFPCQVVLQYCLHQVRCCLFFTGRLFNPTTNILDEIWGMRSIQSKRLNGNWDYIIIIVKTLVFL